MRVGFIGVRWPKGIGVLLEDFARLIESKGHEVHFLAYPISRRRGVLLKGDWKRDHVTIVETFRRSTVYIENDTLERWLKSNQIEVLFTIEQPNNPNTFSICKSLGIPTINYVDVEMFNPSIKEKYQDCSIFMCPTQQCYDRLFEYGLKNVMRVRYIANIKEYPWTVRKANGPVEFVMHAGWGGASGRKGVEPTIKAFAQAALLNAKLIVITQKRWKSYDAEIQNLAASRKNIQICEMNDTKAVYNSFAYQRGHIVVQPSKWEGLGLTYIEAMISGLPAIVTNAAPMNEFVKHEKTGLLVDCKLVPGNTVKKDLPIPAALVDVDKLAETFARVTSNPECVEQMSLETQKFRNQYYEYVESMCELFKRIDRPL